MGYRRYRGLLCIASAAVLSVGVLATAALIFGSIPVASGEGVVESARQLDVQQEAGIRRLDRGDFAGLWGKQLQRPLVDPAPPKLVTAESPIATVPPVQIHAVLQGTAVDSDPGKSVAWIKFDTIEATRLMRVGESAAVPGAPVVREIGERYVVFQVGTQEQRIEMDRE